MIQFNVRKYLPLLTVLFIYCAIVPVCQPQDSPYIFPGLTGPDTVSVVPEYDLPSFTDYSSGTPSRMAVLLTDTSSTWLGLVHGLKSAGIPFILTTDAGEAARHNVVFVYPRISGSILSQSELQLLAGIPRNGGTLIGTNVLGGLQFNFGFEKAVASHDNYLIRWASDSRLTEKFIFPHESDTRIGDPADEGWRPGTYSYQAPEYAPIATFDDGAAAITQKPYEDGNAYALGLDLGFFFQVAYNGRLDAVARSYVDGYEPSVDVLLRFLKNVYRRGESEAITLGTVPYGKSLSVMISHDIDFHQSLVNAIEYAEYEKSQDIKAAYFIQTKYIKDYYDVVFFNEEGVDYVQQLADMGMEIASHSVAHSPVFSSLPTGTGEETYPEYQPFVFDPALTRNGTILGELRVSKFLLDHFVPNQNVVSFRSGHLEYPFQIPQSLEAAGFRFDSSVTANNVLTHLPFRLTANRDYSKQSNVYEFPVTIEDEGEIYTGNGQSHIMTDKLPQSLELVDKIARYGGVCVVLIHPNVLDHKLEFLKQFVPAVKDRAWFGTLAEFGNWWAARDAVEVDVIPSQNERIVRVNAPHEITGLTLQIPPHYRLKKTDPAITISQDGAMVILDTIQGQIDVKFTLSDITSNVGYYGLFE